MKNNKNNNNNNFPVGKVLIIGCIAAFVIGMVILFANTDSRDIAHDEDGFLGYSDSFWEWYQDNN